MTTEAALSLPPGFPDHPTHVAHAEFHSVAAWGDVNLVCWRRVTTEGLEAVRERHLAIAGKHGSVCALNVSSVGMPLPGRAVSRTAARLMRDSARSQRCAVTVVQGTGLWAATARNALSVVQWLSRDAYPLRVAATVEEGADWLATFTGRDGDWGTALGRVVSKLQQGAANHTRCSIA